MRCGPIWRGPAPPPRVAGPSKSKRAGGDARPDRLPSVRTPSGFVGEWRGAARLIPEPQAVYLLAALIPRRPTTRHRWKASLARSAAAKRRIGSTALAAPNATPAKQSEGTQIESANRLTYSALACCWWPSRNTCAERLASTSARRAGSSISSMKPGTNDGGTSARRAKCYPSASTGSARRQRTATRSASGCALLWLLGASLRPCGANSATPSAICARIWSANSCQA